MDETFEKCPGCGQTVHRQAMRCPRCGRLLITPEEQLARIERLKEGKKGSGLRRLLRLSLFVLLAGAAWYFFSDQIMEVLQRVLGR
jgi:hypothetical protein